jgi:protein-disulfide isomerase
MNTLSRIVVAFALVALASSCNKSSGSTGTVQGTTGGTVAAAAPTENPDMVVATWGDKKLTLKEVDATIAEQLKELESKKFEARQQAAEQMMIEALVKAEAAKVGKTDQQWMQEQAAQLDTAPSEDEVKKIFADAQGQLPPGATYEQVKPQILQFIAQKKKGEVMQKVVGELMKAANGQVLLEEPRTQVEAVGPARGPEGAKVTIVEFSDFECPYCSKAEDSVDQVMKTYAGKVRLVFRHYPLPFHSHAAKAAEAAACAEEQGKFWELHKQMFSNQKALEVADLKGYATAAGMDAGKFSECLDSGRMAGKVKADQEAGSKVGVNGTPAFFINGVKLSGAQPYPKFAQVIDRELAKAK